MTPIERKHKYLLPVLILLALILFNQVNTPDKFTNLLAWLPIPDPISDYLAYLVGCDVRVDFDSRCPINAAERERQMDRDDSMRREYARKQEEATRIKTTNDTKTIEKLDPRWLLPSPEAAQREWNN